MVDLTPIQTTPATPAQIARGVLDLIDETTYHAVGSNWEHLNQLIDCQGVFGTLADWVVVAGCETHELPIDDDSAESLAEHLHGIAAEMLGVEDWGPFECLPFGKAKEVLESIAEGTT